MNDRFQYKLSASQKNEIAQNLIDILQKDIDITDQTRGFIGNWILTVSDEKRKAFFDVWNIVLKNYLPMKRPILFRACKRINRNDKITSFTGSLDCAKGFSNGKGLLIICDTKETLKFEEELYKIGDYRHTFYPLVDVLVKARDSGGWGFSERILREYIGEDEYIMRINLDNVNSFKWHEINSRT
ncbi:hypothetical protein FNO01nite_29470 [Flavobacterium noncentrifugens]|uniref:Uncharacterized protein n=1 Tax=Flavobacterium noncentrifugens TaxID=1128970 RepID=A0A1G8Y1H0_9FLAO|nr:hypothetical protein [Flavobacterium noncentrifugens]GEP52275.1 hypothetical protein FNO01nite_29470 [Flavobacterium noncentrifugens]SDJ96699.1 hypothetical protein SAMN04487935_2155 [Flavobacterium noncentrifugens]